MATNCPQTGQDRDLLIGRAAELAREHFQSGFNCAESVLYGVVTALALPAGDAVLCAATPFGGGMGRAGCACGALTGGMIALGLVMGRTEPDAARKDAAYAHAEHLWQQFTAEAGAEDCRDLNTLGFAHPDHKEFCARFVAIGAGLAAKEILGSR